ncbi:MAG: hypothetical protein J6Q65_08095, partial [Lentisphaeria bacterium]|nr:hypothetical protein [Lentisphaeria bacterium]
IALVEDAPCPVLKLLSPLEKAGAIGKLDIFHISYVQNSQRFFPPFRYPDPTPSEIPEQTANHDLVIVAPPIPTERSAAFLSTAVFFKQVCDALPDNGILAVFATGSDAQNMTLYHSMPSGTVRINGENSTWFVCRKDGGKLELDGKELGKRLPEILRHYGDAMQLVFPLLQKNALPVPDGDLANRPFHSPLLRLIDPTPEMPALSFIRSWHGVLFAAALVLYLLMRYFISWKPVHKPCFQAFEAGLLAMLLPAAAVIGGASFGCGPIFSIIPAVTAVFAATYFYLLLLPEEKYANYNMFPLVLAILLFLAGWDLPAATAIIGALLLWNARKRPVPELSDAQRIYPQAWLMTGMAIALTAATFFLKMPI